MKMKKQRLLRRERSLRQFMSCWYLSLTTGALVRYSSELRKHLQFFRYLHRAAVPGLFIGCLIANITGGCGYLGIVFGSLATLIGAVGTYMLRKHPWAAPLPPILANTVIVPFVLKYAYGTEGMLWYFMLTVGLGEVIVCGVLGSLLRVALKKYRNTLFHE